MVLSDATEKIPSDTTGHRSGTFRLVATMPPQALKYPLLMSNMSFLNSFFFSKIDVRIKLLSNLFRGKLFNAQK
jgi:hypothetical protein